VRKIAATGDASPNRLFEPVLSRIEACGARNRTDWVGVAVRSCVRHSWVVQMPRLRRCGRVRPGARPTGGCSKSSAGFPVGMASVAQRASVVENHVAFLLTPAMLTGAPLRVTPRSGREPRWHAKLTNTLPGWRSPIAPVQANGSFIIAGHKARQLPAGTGSPTSANLVELVSRTCCCIRCGTSRWSRVNGKLKMVSTRARAADAAAAALAAEKHSRTRDELATRSGSHFGANLRSRAEKGMAWHPGNSRQTGRGSQRTESSRAHTMPPLNIGKHCRRAIDQITVGVLGAA